MLKNSMYNKKACGTKRPTPPDNSQLAQNMKSYFGQLIVI
ncbi:hypothetical protein K5E_13010 [Enterococcus thailandicus]|nr:hypothetical protein K2F_16140 [Enterococcus thailandicus]GMC09162.1 hypothetical protein K5E_13010 [Enterococcus thailandicus]